MLHSDLKGRLTAATASGRLRLFMPSVCPASKKAHEPAWAEESKEIGGDITNKPCGIGSVGFPRPLLPVAIGAVSLESERHTVSVCATELPLSPHCNLCYILIDSLGAFLGSLGSPLASFAAGVSTGDRCGFR